ncbi:ABC transporter permease [Paramixta manurensis]|uniref:ABC transporter permease n=1 Tax=Paramixta manurensis TaxID=2740817 RepID=UPI00156B5D71
MTQAQKLAIGTAASMTLLAVWQAASWLGWLDPVFLPSPLAILRSLVDMFLHQDLLTNIGISCERILLAFLLSVIMAVPLGLLMSCYPVINAALEPVNDFIRYLPTPALVPISIIWFGIGEETKVFLLWLGTFFQLILLVVEDANRVPNEFIEMAKTLGAKPRQIIVDIIWKKMLPSLFNNLRVMLGWCWTYLILAEIVASDSGLGYVIWNARRYMQTDQMMAGVFIIGVIGMFSDQLMRALHRRIFHYQ